MISARAHYIAGEMAGCSHANIESGGNYGGGLSPFALHNCRTPSGKPEGYLETLSNIYRNFALTLSDKLEGRARLQMKWQIFQEHREEWLLLIR